MIVMFFTLLITHNAVSQEIRTVAPDEVLENEVFQIQYDIFSEVPIKTMPNFVDDKGFELVSDPQIKQSSPSPFWGIDYYTYRIVCHFKPKKAGSFKLPRIELLVDGDKLSSKKRTIEVYKLPELGEVDCFVKVEATRKQLNIGDTLTVTYKLYTTKEISGIANLDLPRVGGFNYQDMTPQKQGYNEEQVEGVNYKVYVFCKLLLQATRVGAREMPEGSVKIEYSHSTGRVGQDGWGQSYEEQLRYSKDCSIESVSIMVQDMITI